MRSFKGGTATRAFPESYTLALPSAAPAADRSSKALREVLGFEDATLGDDAGNKLSRRHMERGIVHIDSGGGDRLTAVNGGDLRGVALLDRDVGARFCVQIDC